MKTATLLVVLSIGFVHFASATKDVSLEEAVKNGLLTVAFNGMDHAEDDAEAADIAWTAGTHFGKCIKLMVTNNSTQLLRVTLEAGRLLNAHDNDVQDMVVTQQLAFVIPARQKQEHTLYAMCTEMNDRGPSSAHAFMLGLMAEADLQGMAKLVEKYNVQNETGQDAVWVITDDLSVDAIDGDDAQVTAALRQYASEVVKKRDTSDNGSRYNVPVYRSSVEFGYRLLQDANVSLIVYDPNGAEFMSLLSDKPHQPGVYSITYSFERSDLQPGIYTLKMFQNGRFVTFKQFRVE